MSENITHTGSLDDTFRLASRAETICQPFRTVMQEKRDFARLGGVTRSGDLFTVSLLTAFRERWNAGTQTDKDAAKLAFVLGWLCHRAADRQMKPVFRNIDPEGKQNPREVSIYNDALIYREVYANGQNEPYSLAFLNENLPGEEIFRVLLQRALLELHTLAPDLSDGEGWLDRLFDLQQTYYVDRARYAEAILNPDPDKVRRYLIEPNFYDSTEPIIATARIIQHGENKTSDDVIHAVGAKAHSHYAHILKMAFGYIQAASDFFTGEMTPDELSESLNIGKMGADGKHV